MQQEKGEAVGDIFLISPESVLGCRIMIVTLESRFGVHGDCMTWNVIAVQKTSSGHLAEYHKAVVPC